MQLKATVAYTFIRSIVNYDSPPTPAACYSNIIAAHRAPEICRTISTACATDRRVARRESAVNAPLAVLRRHFPVGFLASATGSRGECDSCRIAGSRICFASCCLDGLAHIPRFVLRAAAPPP